MRVRVLWVLVPAMLLLAAACAPTAETTERTEPAQATGIGAKTAKERGVFAADGDARLTIESHETSSEGTILQVSVTNISRADDSYSVVLLADDETVGTASVEVNAESTVSVEVRSDATSVDEVRLDGKLLGEGVAQHPVE